MTAGAHYDVVSLSNFMQRLLSELAGCVCPVAKARCLLGEFRLQERRTVPACASLGARIKFFGGCRLTRVVSVC